MELGKICVSLAGADAAAICEQARQVADLADVLEIRLDSMVTLQVRKCCSLLQKPLLFTNRPVWEGGAWDRPEEQRIMPLFEAIRCEAAYVDFELRADVQLRRRLLAAMRIAPTRMILSWHNFDLTPPAGELFDILAQMIDSGTHVGKIVTMAHSPDDVLRVLRLQEHARAENFPLICFCMGAAGRISRFATLYLGGYMTYACLNEEQATAPGQIAAARLRELIAHLA